MLRDQLQQIIGDVVRTTFPDAPEREIIIEYPNNADHGDYSCNIAMQLAKPLQKSPREVAEIIVERLGGLDFVQTTEIAGPGFINFYVKPDYLVENLKSILRGGESYGRNVSGQDKTLMVEYSSPNTNKPLHLGHARNNFLGMALANILHANGYEVLKTQIINDRGIHICKSMLAYDKWGGDETPESTGMKGDHFVGKYYVKYSQELKENPDLEKEAHEMLQAWEAGDEKVRALWEKMNAWVLEGFNETYELMGSHFDQGTFESDISEGGRAIVEAALEKGQAERVEGGAVAIDLSESGLGDSETGRKILIRSNGTTVYITQDIQLAIKRMDGGDVDRLIYVVGNEQDYHFKVLFEILKRFGHEWAERCFHMSYGMVNLPSGKLKSREGKSVDIDSLVEELRELVDQEIEERKMDYDESEKAEITNKIALSALKYYILRVDNKSTLLYDPKSSIDFQGDTGPYLLYTYARLHSILRKAGDQVEKIVLENVETERLATPEELAILRELQLYPEVVYLSGQDYRVHTLANALHELAQATNRFYGKHQVLEGVSDEQRAARLQLIAAVAQVLENGLNLLGIEVVERM